MRSGQLKGMLEGTPAEPGYTLPSPTPAGTLVLVSSDKSYTVELTQVGGAWYVSKAPL
jgi:hypothetical protein